MNSINSQHSSGKGTCLTLLLYSSQCMVFIKTFCLPSAPGDKWTTLLSGFCAWASHIFTASQEQNLLLFLMYSINLNARVRIIECIYTESNQRAVKVCFHIKPVFTFSCKIRICDWSKMCF